MENSLFPAPPDILRKRADELRKSIAQNNTAIAQITVAISLLQNDQASLEVKVLNRDTFQVCYSYAWVSVRVRDAVLEGLESDHQTLGRQREKLLNLLADVDRQLTALGMNEPATGSGDQ